MSFFKKKFSKKSESTSHTEPMTIENIDPRSTWGRNLSIENVNTQTLERYLAAIKKTIFFLKIVASVLVIVVLGLVLKLCFFQDFELYIFEDGTSYHCIYDPETGVMK